MSGTGREAPVSMTNRIASTIAVLALLLGAGCVNEVDRAVDCANICERYQDCLPGDQDESECRDRCNDRTTEEADACDACLDASGCSDCTVECAGPLAGA